jgi:hypothetical protein
MWAVIGAVSLVASIVLLIIGIVGKFKKKVFIKRSFWISLCAFALFIVAIINTPTTKAETATPTPEPTKSVATTTPIPSAEPVKVEVPVKQDPAGFAKTVTLKHFTSADVKYTADSGWLEITAAGKDNVTDDLIKVGIQSSIVDTLKELKEQTEIKDVIFKITLPMSDKLGNVTNPVVVQATLLKATRDKINWDNFSYSNLPDIADSYGGQFSK